MTLLILSFIAGVLTVAAPCILPLLPVVIGGSAVQGAKTAPQRRWIRPVVISASLALSVIVFSLAIKGTTALLGVPQQVWQVISGGIVTLLGLHFLWPHAWEVIAARSTLSSNRLLGRAYRQGGFGGDILMGAALGPVFSSCSPTYALIVASILPVSFLEGFIYLVAYATGMSATLLLIAFAGQAFVAKLKWLSNPNGVFKKVVGVLFVAVGLAVILGFDKQFQTFVLDRGWYAPIENIERRLGR